jgi:hypothetical protein
MRFLFTRFIAAGLLFAVGAAACSSAAEEVIEDSGPSDSVAAVEQQISEQNAEMAADRQEEMLFKYAGAVEEARLIDYAVMVYVNEVERQQAEAAAAAAAAAQYAAAQYAVAAAPSGGSGGSNYASGAGGNLASIRACESGGNYATNTGNGFYGAYQFDQQTWNSVGGSGNPANASPAEQDSRANALIAQRGTSPWPNCG